MTNTLMLFHLLQAGSLCVKRRLKVHRSRSSLVSIYTLLRFTQTELWLILNDRGMGADMSVTQKSCVRSHALEDNDICIRTYVVDQGGQQKRRDKEGAQYPDMGVKGYRYSESVSTQLRMKENNGRPILIVQRSKIGKENHVASCENSHSPSYALYAFSFSSRSTHNLRLVAGSTCSYPLQCLYQSHDGKHHLQFMNTQLRWSRLSNHTSRSHIF